MNRVSKVFKWLLFFLLIVSLCFLSSEKGQANNVSDTLANSYQEIMGIPSLEKNNSPEKYINEILPINVKKKKIDLPIISAATNFNGTEIILIFKDSLEQKISLKAEDFILKGTAVTVVEPSYDMNDELKRTIKLTLSGVVESEDNLTINIIDDVLINDSGKPFRQIIDYPVENNLSGTIIEEFFYPSMVKDSIKSSDTIDGVTITRVIHRKRQTPLQDIDLVKPEHDDLQILVENKKDKIQWKKQTNNRVFDNNLKIRNIETNSHSSHTDKFPIKNGVGLYKIQFAAQTGQELLKFTHDNVDIIISPQNPAHSNAITNRNTIVYERIYPNIDLKYTAEDYQVKEELILHQYTGLTEFYFNLNVNNVSYELKPDGEIHFYQPESRDILFYIPTPFAVDNKGSHCNSVKSEITSEGMLKISLDPDWLKGAIYPVVLDPTISLISREVYQASIDFSITQGQNNWYYREQSNDVFCPMNWDANGYWLGQNNAKIGNNWIYPSDRFPIRVWKAPYEGKITITGNIHKIETGGDGVSACILKNDIQIWPASVAQYIAPNDTTGVNINIKLTVNAGDEIKFKLTQNTNNQFDKTFWDPSIKYELSGLGIEEFLNYLSGPSLGSELSALINTSNLNLILQKPIFSIPGRGIPIEENLTYNSLDNRNGVLGVGWRLNTETSIAEQQDGSIILFEGDGSFHIFNPSGINYTAPPGIYLTLTKESNPVSYKIKDKKQNVYTYDVNGRLTSIVDESGNTTTYTYGASSKLQEITDASGRKITYTYNMQGLLEKITDPANRFYQMGYTGNYLTTITNPENQTYTFSYDGNGLVRTVTDPLSRVTTFVCDPVGKLIYYDDARSTPTDRYTTSFSQSIIDSRKMTTVIDPGNQSFKYYHDLCTNNMVKYEDPLSNTWFYEWTNNNLTKAQDAIQFYNYEYDNRGNMTKKSLWGVIDWRMTYDDKNQLLKVIEPTYGHGIDYKYDIKGNLLTVSSSGSKESNGKLYNENGNVVQSSPMISRSYSLLRNGSFESNMAYWTSVSDYRGASCDFSPGFNSHGYNAAKFTNYSGYPSTHYLYQTADEPLYVWNYVTLSADIKVDNIQYSGTEGGAFIEIEYGKYGYERYYFSGTGRIPFVIPSRPIRNDGYTDVAGTIKIGVSNITSGTAWFDAVQLERNGEGSYFSAFNAVDNGTFKYFAQNWVLTNPYNAYYRTSSNIQDPSNYFIINYLGGTALYQDVSVYPGEKLTLSGLVRTENVNQGVYLKVYFIKPDGYSIISSVQTGTVKGTTPGLWNDYVRLSCKVDVPLDARYARVCIMCNGSGSGYFDDIKLIPRNTTEYSYDEADGQGYLGDNYVVKIVDPLNKENSFTYDKHSGAQLSIKDALNYETKYAYDNLNRLIKVTDPLTHSAYYGYDAVSNLTYTRAPGSAGPTDNSFLTQFIPTLLNQKDTIIDPLLKNVKHAYDRCGNLIKTELPNGKTIDYEYDAAHRLKKKTIDGGKYYEYSYDGANNLKTVVDQDGHTYTYNYSYDNKVTSSKDDFNFNLKYSYLQCGPVTNNGVTYYVYGTSYQLLDMMVGAILPVGWENPIYLNIKYGYDERGNLFSVSYPGKSIFKSMSYEQNGLCTQIFDTMFPGNARIRYEYADNGNITSIVSWAGTDSYSYDGYGRLLSWNRENHGVNLFQESYTYDGFGNLLQKGTNSYSYNAANQIINSGYNYDNNGNLTSDGTYNYSYNAENQLTEVKRVSDNSLLASYTYYHNGLRKSKTVNGITTNFHWDVFNNMVRESNASGQTLALYHYDTSGRVVAMRKNDNCYTYHTNLRGDILVVDYYNYLTGVTTVQAQYDYDPWGNILSQSGISQPFKYAGYYYDEETGLYYLKNRYYSPKLGRFLTKDPYPGELKNPSLLHPYLYCSNNPVIKVDPDGDAWFLIAAPAGATAIRLAPRVFSAVKAVQLTRTINKGAASQTTKLYRVMSEGEYNSLVKSGQFTQYDKAMESKWFATNAKDAAEWGKKFYPNGNYKMVEIEVPKDSLSQMYNVNKLDNIGPAYNAERDFINSVIKSIKEVTR